MAHSLAVFILQPSILFSYEAFPKQQHKIPIKHMFILTRLQDQA